MNEWMTYTNKCFATGLTGLIIDQGEYSGPLTEKLELFQSQHSCQAVWEFESKTTQLCTDMSYEEFGLSRCFY